MRLYVSPHPGRGAGRQGTRQHTSAYVSIRQHTSASIGCPHPGRGAGRLGTRLCMCRCSAPVSTPQPSAYVSSILQHTSAYVPLLSSCIDSSTVSIRQQHTSAYVSVCAYIGAAYIGSCMDSSNAACRVLATAAASSLRLLASCFLSTRSSSSTSLLRCSARLVSSVEV
jgi:hypothetical protein